GSDGGAGSKRSGTRAPADGRSDGGPGGEDRAPVAAVREPLPGRTRGTAVFDVGDEGCLLLDGRVGGRRGRAEAGADARAAKLPAPEAWDCGAQELVSRT